MNLNINGEAVTFDVKDKFFVLTGSELTIEQLNVLRDKIKKEGGLGVLSFPDTIDIRTIQPQNSLLIVTTNDFSKEIGESLREQLYGLGCLGFINLPEDSKIESLGVKQLENIVKEIKSMRQEGVKDEQD